MKTASKTGQKAILKFIKDEFENQLWKQQKTAIGIDEVGRGCLAGPLVIGAVILPIGITSELLQDSKILDETQREKAYAWIVKNCQFQTAILHNRCIDQHNIYQATLMGMRKVVVQFLSSMPTVPGAILVDAMPLTLTDTGLTPIPIYYFPKGEARSSSIAAASIVAKVTRDRLMTKYATLFPGYMLEQHKGYATKTHYEAINSQRHTIIHRTTFLGAILDNQELNESDIQQRLC